ncbi:MAG TPA: peptidase M19 [Verrucomicrobiales bacterium]|nr:peptidase M19 [Verrucomicrobiales bacterium]
MFFFDAHLDLAMNALEWNRDLTQPIGLLREREAGKTDKPDRRRGTVCLPEMRRGRVGLCVATQIARVEHNAYSPVFGWASPSQAWAQTRGQLAWYRAMEGAGEMVQIRDLDGLERHLRLWGNGSPADETAPDAPLPVGYILSLEGADSVLSMKHLEQSWQDGLRALGPAHYGPGVYAMGTDAEGGFNQRGRELLRVMDELGLILDVSHLSDDCLLEALDLFAGPIWASHSNCRSLVPHQRQFSDEQLRLLINRGAVIGAALDAWMMIPGWVRGKTTPEATGLKLDRLCDHIDHVCQLAGNANHSGIGTDLDGAFGREQCPLDVETIADVARLPALLAARGFSPADIERIASGNFLRFLRDAWNA